MVVTVLKNLVELPRNPWITSDILPIFLHFQLKIIPNLLMEIKLKKKVFVFR